jgi:hypothetical protein
MGKHDAYRHSSNDRQTRKPEIHPVWRGIGFVFMILIPVIAYAGAVVLIEENNKQGWMPFPYDLMATPKHILFRLFQDQLIHIKLIVMGILMFLMYAVFSFITFLVTSAFGVSRYGPYDLPPVERPKHIRRAR